MCLIINIRYMGNASLITSPILPLAIIALFSKKCFYYKGCKNVPELLLPEIKTKNGFP